MLEVSRARILAKMLARAYRIEMRLSKKLVTTVSGWALQRRTVNVDIAETAWVVSGKPRVRLVVDFINERIEVRQWAGSGCDELKFVVTSLEQFNTVGHQVVAHLVRTFP